MRPEKEEEKNQENLDNNEKEVYNNDDEIVVEDLSNDDSLKKLRDKLKLCVSEKQDYLNGWQRAKADFVNYKKSEEDRNRSFLNFAKEEFVTEFLPVLDSFTLAKHSSEWNEGMEQVFKQLLSILRKSGLEELNPLGQDFDPRFHEAIAMVEGEGEQEGKILEVVQSGYLLQNKIIRPARVKIGK